ncbi:MAG: 16S rRNA methyltransferase [Candidatus Methanomethylicus sp.]|nr:16S rRNA methyltransferase [Candidatus Methanomethylicus sp.]
MITIVIAEAALEMVPKELLNHPSVTRAAERKGKKPEETLLDISYHYAAMKNMENWDRRGRPDITYLTLLNLLERPLNKTGQLTVYVHTLDNYILEIDREINLPRNYARFQGLIEQLFEVGRVPPLGKPLMLLKRGTLEDIVKNVSHSSTILLTEKGKTVRSGDYFPELLKKGDPLIVIGGFQRGEFSKQNLKLADEKISLYKDALDTWIIASMVSHELERAKGII